MKKLVIVTTPLLLLMLAVCVFGCGSSDEKTYIEVVKMLPQNTSYFDCFDVQSFRNDDDLRHLYDQIMKEEMEYSFVDNNTGVVISNIEWLVDAFSTVDGYSSDWDIEIWGGEFNLSHVRTELSYHGYHENEYEGIEIWEYADDPESTIAIIDSKLIGGDPKGVKECIDTIQDSERSLYYNPEVREILDRVPKGIAYGVTVHGKIDGFQAVTGSSSGKAGKDRLWYHTITGYQDEEAAEDALEEMKKIIEEQQNYEQEFFNYDIDYDIYRSGRFLEIRFEVYIDDVLNNGPTGDNGPTRDYETDREVLQLAAAVFYSDVHGGWDSYAVGGARWGCSDPTVADDPGHYYPTELATVNSHILTLSTTILDPDNPENPRIEGISGAANDSEISRHAIWMGLLVNLPGDYVSMTGKTDRGAVSALKGETGLYLQEMPESAMAGNEWNGAPPPGGSYCWVVGKYGIVFGVYKGLDGHWYSGYNGVYP